MGTDQEYSDLLEELKNKGLLADGKEIAESGGLNPLQILDRQRHSNASLLASVPNVEQHYKKDEQDKALLLDLMNRTNFRSRNEIIYFLDWVDWCEEFEVGFNAPIRYCVAINSEGGRARQEYTDAITTMRFRQYGNNRKDDKPKFERGESKLS